MDQKMTYAGMAGAVVLASGSVAYGDVVAFANGLPADIVADGTTDFDRDVPVDVDGDGTTDFSFNFRGTPITPGAYEYQANIFLDAPSLATISGYTGFFVSYYGTNLASGASVAGSGLVGQPTDPIYGSQIALGSNYGGLAYGGFGTVGSATSTGFVGFQLTSGNFGYIEIEVSDAGISFLSGAYDNMGNDIAAGAPIPEPATASLAILAVGAAATRRGRRN
ncbi:MAG: PEP-CTERM sorting domain-containing protein [Planctomycetota bacterium]